MNKNYGYVRVSTRDQHTDRQITALKELDVHFDVIYVDKLSGKDFNRPQYKKMVRKLKEGDVIYIKSIDRLGRNYDDIIEQWRYIIKEKKADIVVMDMPLLDTRRKDNDLTGKFVADLVLQILSYVAQTEREAIKQRQREGIAAAKERGVKFGRERFPTPANFQEYKEKWERREITVKEGAAAVGIRPATFHRWCREGRE